ncbi:MAG TPA: cytidylate kinase-like family protein [Anaerolineales bacterium]
MAAITVSRQLGSLGYEISRLSAQALGYRFVWRELINQAARQSGAPEVALATIDDLGLLGISPSPKARLAYRLAVKRIMESLADEGGAVILGRAGQVILGGRPDVLHVRVIAPVDLRIRRVAEIQKISLESAQAQVETTDRNRRNYLKRFYHAHWDDPVLYDLVINTANLTPAAAATLIRQALDARLSGNHPSASQQEKTAFGPNQTSP